MTVRDALDYQASFRRLRAEFGHDAPEASAVPGARTLRRQGRWLELMVNGEAESVVAWLEGAKAVRVESEALALEDIFMAAVGMEGCLP